MRKYRKLKKFLKEQEGYSPDVYADTEGNPTVGFGANLNSPEVDQYLSEMGKDKERILSGEESLDPTESDQLKDMQLQDKQQFLEAVKKRDFPQAQIEPNEQDALLSMAYNSPQLIGPNMRKLLNENRKEDVSKEILLRSNRDKTPGIQKRRLEESRMYSGPNFENIVKTLKPEEIHEIRNIINNIKNVNEREKVLQEYPFLNEIVPYRPFNKVFKKY